MDVKETSAGTALRSREIRFLTFFFVILLPLLQQGCRIALMLPVNNAVMRWAKQDEVFGLI